MARRTWHALASLLEVDARTQCTWEAKNTKTLQILHHRTLAPAEVVYIVLSRIPKGGNSQRGLLGLTMSIGISQTYTPEESAFLP